MDCIKGLRVSLIPVMGLVPMWCSLQNHDVFCKIFRNSAATASPTSDVLADPPISFVRMPFSMTALTAPSIAFASAGRLSDSCNIIAADRMAATGFTTPFPEMSGAEPVVPVSIAYPPEAPN